MTNLKELEIDGYGLKSIPSEVFNLIHLTLLNLHRNEIMEVSDGIIALERLRILRINNNKLKKLSSKIGLLPHLIELHLQENELSEIPL